MSIPSPVPPAYYGNIESLRGRKDPEAMKAAARELEALFAYEMVKAMRATIGTDKQGGLGRDAYLSIFDMELSRLLAERGLGLQDMVVRSLNRQAVPQDVIRPASPAPGPSITQKTVPEEKSTQSDETAYPVKGPISSSFGMRRHPIDGKFTFHRGVDIAAPAGTEIRPFKDGVVVFSGFRQGYGNLVVIDHGDGFTTKYAHNQVNLVKAGDEVGVCTVIAKVGSTGRSTGPHLHFEVSFEGHSVNPLMVLAKSGY